MLERRAAAFAWGIASVDEKHSLNGSLSNVENGSGTETSTPFHAISPEPVTALKSTPATMPSFTGAFPTPAAQVAQQTAAPSAPKFELTSLIKTLPEPSRPITPPPPPTILQPQQAEPAIEHAAPIVPATPAIAPLPQTPPAQIRTTITAPPAPSFTPLIAPNARPAPASPSQVAKPPAPAPATLLLNRLTHYASTTARFAAIAFAAWFVTVLVLIAAFRFINPPQSMLMLTQRLGGQTLQHEWTPLEQISTNLRRAVITSEDGKFCRHWGFDLGEIRAAMRSTDGYGRGASTITQQLSKNLFLWNGKSYIRKGLEVPLTLAMEALWSKKRILEVYLNFAEWGPGVFGAEAAAQYYYSKPASQLTEREAALLAVSLPNPIARDASDPNPAIARRASTLQARMRVQGISYCALTPKKN